MATLASVSSKTMVPLGFVITLLGGAAWLTDVRGTAVGAQKSADEVMAAQVMDQKKVAEKLDSVSDRLSRMEGQLSVILDNLSSRERPRK